MLVGRFVGVHALHVKTASSAAAPRRFVPYTPPPPLRIDAQSIRPGSLALREGCGREPACPILVSFEDGFSLYSPWTGRRVSAAARGTTDEYEQLPGTRLNDGR